MAEREILIEAARHLATKTPLVLGLALVAGLAIAAESLLERWASSGGRRLLRQMGVCLAIGLGLSFAWEVLWLADDAFISFRYARNLAEGLGLVYNEGEWVEGYTNFLWTAALGGLGWLGIDIPTAGFWGNILCFVATLAVVSAVVARLEARAVIPFSAIALACLSPFYVFASSGLETMPLALLLALAMWASTWRHGVLVSSLILIAAAMTRPDHLLIYGCMGLALAIEDLLASRASLLRRLRLRRLLLYAAPFVLIYVPYFLIRWKVYGDPMPNTYYAKSGGMSYFSQGRIYLVHFLATTGAWFWFPLFLLAIFQRPERARGFFTNAREPEASKGEGALSPEARAEGSAARSAEAIPSEALSRDELRLRVFTVLSAGLFGFYVAKVGGDFMEHRFFVPLLPALAISTELSLRGWLRSAATVRAELLLWGACGLALALALVPVQLLEPFEKRWHLAAEYTFYPVLQAWPLQVSGAYLADGKALREHLGPLGIRPALAGDAIGFLGYYSELPIVDAFGLTNRRIGHKPLEWRGRPGHEKYATVEELIEEGAVLSVIPFWGPRSVEETGIRLGEAKVYLLRPDAEVEAALSRIPGVEVPKVEERIRTLVTSRPRAELVEVAPFYRRYLAGHEQGGRLLAALETRLREIADFEEGALPSGAHVEGEAFEVLEGTPPLGGSGLGWLSSMGRRGDGRGRLELPLPILDGSELRFGLGGARSRMLQVRLEVDGEVRRQARPGGGRELHPVVWDLRELRGRRATLVIEDDDPRDGVGMLVDGIHFGGGQGDIRERIVRWQSGGDADLALLLQEAELVLPSEDPDVALLEEGILERWTFDESFPPGTEVEGIAFGRGPVLGGIRGQQPVSGKQGARFLNSYHGGDRGMGTLRLPERELGEGGISLLVGGGDQCALTFVGLEVEGKVVARVCGSRDEVLRRSMLPTKEWAGKLGRVVIVDTSTGSWGHILVDDVIFLR